MPGVKGQTRRDSLIKTARGRMWKAMRMSRHFTVADLAALADTSRSNARVYVRQLVAHGYLRVVAPAGPGKGVYGRREAALALVNDSGPEPPRFHKDGSYTDRNVQFGRLRREN